MGSNHIIAFWFRSGFTEHFRQFTVDARGGVMSGSDKPGSSPCILPPPFSTTLCSFLLPLCHLSCAHFPKQNWAQLKPCWPIIQQIITRLMIENWRQSHSGRLKWSHNGRLMHFSEQIRKQSQEIDSVSLQVNANKIISSPPKIRNLCPRRRVSLTDHLECLLLRDGHGILRLMITGEIRPLSRDFGWHPKFDAHKWTSTGKR